MTSADSNRSSTMGTQPDAADDEQPMRAGIISGLYGRELCTLTDEGYTQVGNLPWIDPADLVHLNVLDEACWPTEHAEVRWRTSHGHPVIAFTGAGVATCDELRTAISGLRPDGRYALTTIAAMADEGHEWAATAIEWARAQNKVARKDKSTRRPIWLNASQLIAIGVPRKAIRALPPASTLALGASADLLDRWDIKDRDANTEQAREGLRALDLDAEVLTMSGLAALEPVSPLIDQFLARGQLAELVGRPGSGKTFVALSMALSVALGTTWCGYQVPEAGPVVYIAAEGAEGVRARALAWCAARDIDPAELEGRFIVSPVAVQMGEADHMAQLRDLVKRTGAVLVVFDTRARTTVGLEENSATDQGKAILAADRVREETGAALLVVHHVTEGTDRGRGSTAWLGAVWSSLLVTLKDRTDVTITCVRHKEWAGGCRHHFTLQPRTVAVPLTGGMAETRHSTCVLTGVDPMTADTETEQQRADNGEVWAVIDAHPGQPVSALKQTDMAQTWRSPGSGSTPPLRGWSRRAVPSTSGRATVASGTR